MKFHFECTQAELIFIIFHLSDLFNDLENGVIAALGAEAGGASTISLRTTSGDDTSILNFYGGDSPSSVGFADSSFLTCGRCAEKGVSIKTNFIIMRA